MAKLSRRGRAFREFRRSMVHFLLFTLLIGAMCAAVATLAILSAKHLPLPDGWDAVPYMAAVPLYMVVIWLASSWSAALTERAHARARAKEPPRFSVTFDDETITSSGEDRDDETVAWADLTEVVIINEDAFPIGWQYWLLAGRDGKGAVVSSDANGMPALLAAMQERLPGFNNEAVILAMASVDGAFPVWKKPA